MASGAVQLWNGTDAAFVLLADGRPVAAPSQKRRRSLLDFAYNHGDRTASPPLVVQGYSVRFGSTRSAIDHPQFSCPVTGQFEALVKHALGHVPDRGGRKAAPSPATPIWLQPQTMADARADGQYNPAGRCPWHYTAPWLTHL